MQSMSRILGVNAAGLALLAVFVARGVNAGDEGRIQAGQRETPAGRPPHRRHRIAGEVHDQPLLALRTIPEVERPAVHVEA